MRLASTWPVEHRGAGDRHRAEAVDDAAGHVHRDHDRGALDRGRDGHQQDPGGDVVQVAGPPGVAAGEPATEPVAELAAEDVDEQQQEHDRHPDQHQRHRRVAPQTAQVAPQQRGRVGDGVGQGVIGRGSSSAVGWPVTAKNTSSRSGVWIESCSTSTPASSSSVEQPAQRRDTPVVGHLEDEPVLVTGRAIEHARRRARAPRAVGELELNVTAGNPPLQLVGAALGDDPAAVENRDPVRELVRLVEVLGREKDRDAVGDQRHGCCPTSCGGCGDRAPSWARRGRSRCGEPTRVMARSSRRRIPPE